MPRVIFLISNTMSCTIMIVLFLFNGSAGPCPANPNYLAFIISVDFFELISLALKTSCQSMKG